MIPCPQNQTAIAELALGTLNESTAPELHEHIRDCPRCREYYEELRQVTQALQSAKPSQDTVATDHFHARLLDALKSQPAAPVKTAYPFHFRPALAWAAAAVLALSVGSWMLNTAKQTQPVVTVKAVPPKPQADPPPTLAAYENAARKSSETLDGLLKRHANTFTATGPVQSISEMSRIELEQ